jgi:hypothetical protein
MASSARFPGFRGASRKCAETKAPEGAEFTLFPGIRPSLAPARHLRDLAPKNQ